MDGKRRFFMKFKKTITALALSTLVVSSFNSFSLADSRGEFNAKIVTVADTVSYLTIDAKHLGSPIKELFLDGVKTEFTRVTDDGQIVKTEFNGKHSTIKIVLEDGRVDEKAISGIYNHFPYKSATSTPKAPDLVTGHASIAVWDYHDVQKNSAGEEIQFPESTTFEVNEDAKPIDVVSAPTSKSDEPLSIEFNTKDTSIHEYNGGDIILKFRSNNSDYYRFFNRFRSVYIDGKNIKLKSSKVKVNKDSTDKFNKVIIKAEDNSSLDSLEGNFKLRLKFAGLSDRKIDFTKVSTKSVDENPNPAEDTADNIIDYGKDIVIKYNLRNSDEYRRYNRLKSAYNVYSDGHEESVKLSKHKDGNTGIATISFANSKALQQRGKHEIRLAYRGLSSEKKEFILKDKAPVFKLNSNNGEYKTKKSLLFTLDGFEYMFQQNTGVQAVYINGHKLTRSYVPNDDENIDDLKKKGMKVVENEEENPYHVVQNLLRIKNYGIDALKPGFNYITVKYDNFHDSNFKFILADADSNKKVEKKSSKSRKRRAVDTISSATSGGVGASASIGASAADGSSGGTVNMGMKVVYDFDMVANAKIVEDLGYKNSKAKSLLDYWEGTAKEMALYKNNPYRRVNWDDYLNFVQSNRMNKGKYESFINYYNNSGVSLTKNGYSPLKFALGDGLGAPIFDFYALFTNVTEVDQKIPSSVLSALDNVNVRDNIVLPLNDWTSRIEEISLNGTKLDKGVGYKIDLSNGQLIILGKNFANDGSYNLRIKTKGFEDVTKTILVKSEKNKDTLIRIRNTNENGALFTGESAKFEVMDPEARVTGVLFTAPGKDAVEIENGDGYTYSSKLGQLEISKKLIKTPGTYNARFYFAGRSYKDVSFRVVGESIDFVKSPVTDESSISIDGSVNSFKLSNITGNREIAQWMDSITDIKVNDRVAEKNDDPNSQLPLRYEIGRNKDENFDASSYIYTTTNNDTPFVDNTGDVMVEIKTDGYATMKFSYRIENMKPVSNRNIEINQVDPATGKNVNLLYIKSNFIERNDSSNMVAPFDESQMKSKFPGMRFDPTKRELTNDGSFGEYDEFLNNISKVEINGVRQSFGTTGVLIDPEFVGNGCMKFFL